MNADNPTRLMKDMTSHLSKARGVQGKPLSPTGRSTRAVQEEELEHPNSKQHRSFLRAFERKTFLDIIKTGRSICNLNVLRNLEKIRVPSRGVLPPVVILKWKPKYVSSFLTKHYWYFPAKPSFPKGFRMTSSERGATT